MTVLGCFLFMECGQSIDTLAYLELELLSATNGH